MSKLYEIKERYQNLMELLENEELPKDLINNSLDLLETEFTEKAETICKILTNMKADSEAIKKEEDRLKARRKALENNISNLKEYLESNMQALQLKKLKGNIFSLSIQKNPSSCIIHDLKNIPKDFIVIKEEVNKKDLMDYIKQNEIEIDGVEIKQTESLRIR